tara:strand:+ start:752 stop:1549 length:798 start_codon:yes stop_codon:yes gene_type:complete
MLKFNNNNNLCYLNSLLQFFLNNKKLINYIIEEKYTEYVKKKNKCGLILLSIVNDMLEGNNVPNKNIDFFKHCIDNNKNIIHGEQQCAHEILQLIIEKLSIEKIFYINLLSELHCLDCKYVINSNDKSLYYIDKNNQFNDNKTFEITEDYKCNNCGKKNIIRVDSIDIPPENKFIIILLTESHYEFKSKRKKIINNTIVIKNNKYILKAKILHFGDLNSGHYISIIYKNNKIYKINDSVITEITNDANNDDYFNKNTNILLYNKL